MGGVTTSHGSTSSGIFTRRVEATATNTRFIIYGSKPTGESVTLTVKDMMIFDLTTMFGAGNEPTLAEFEAMFPLNRYYQYDPGQTMELPTNVIGDPLVLLNRRMMMPFNIEPYIVFADPIVEQICATNWGDGVGLKPSQAARVTTAQFGTTFRGNTSITSFDEFRHFTGFTNFTQAQTAFRDCSSLQSIELPASIIFGGNSIRVFDGCTSLARIAINSPNIFAIYAFLNDAALVRVDLPDIDTWLGCRFDTIGSSCPFNASSGGHLYVNNVEVTSVTIPSGTTSIKQGLFFKCIGLTSITIPSTVTSIAQSAFRGCTGLTSLTLPSALTSIEQYAFNGCSNLASISITSSGTTLNTRAFDSCSSLAAITLGGPISLNGQNYQFNQCSSLKRINVPSADDWVKCTWYNNAYPSQYSNEMHVYLTSTNTEITTFTIPSTVTSIGARAFCNCVNVTSVTMASTVTSIGSYAFRSCSSLATVSFSANITSIGNEAFQGTILSGTLTLPSSLVTIGSSAFRGTSISGDLNIPEGVTTIGENAFRDVRTINGVVTIPSTVTSIGNVAFGTMSSVSAFKVNAVTPPTLGGANAFANSTGNIYVPYSSDHSILAAYQSAWSTYTSRLAEQNPDGTIPV